MVLQKDKAANIGNDTKPPEKGGFGLLVLLNRTKWDLKAIVGSRVSRLEGPASAGSGSVPAL